MPTLPAITYRVDPNDPRAPSQEIWDALTDEQRAKVIAELPIVCQKSKRLSLEQELLAQLSSARQQAEAEAQRAETEAQRVHRLVAQLKKLGIEPE